MQFFAASQLRYSARVKQQRDDAEKRLGALQKDCNALREQKKKDDEEMVRLQAHVDEKMKTLSEMESTLAELKRIKNRDCGAE